MYVGLPGTGKTISMVEYLLRLRFRYPKIKIYTNFGFEYQDGEIMDIHDFADINDENGVVFAVDELQLSFQARQFGTFPSEMIFVLTQNRKFKKHFVCTAQLFEHVEKTFRDLTNEVVQCKNWGSRWFFQKAYTTLDYKTKYDPESQKLPFVSWRYSFIATDTIRECYDSYRVVSGFKRDMKRDKDEIVYAPRKAREDSTTGQGAVPQAPAGSLRERERADVPSSIPASVRPSGPSRPGFLKGRGRL